MTGGDACQGARRGRITVAGAPPGRRAADASFLVSGVDAPRGPSVDGDADPGDERGARRGQEAHDVGDVLGRRNAAELVGRLDGRAHLVDRLPRGLRLLL